MAGHGHPEADNNRVVLGQDMLRSGVVVTLEDLSAVLPFINASSFELTSNVFINKYWFLLVILWPENCAKICKVKACDRIEYNAARCNGSTRRSAVLTSHLIG